MKKYNLNRLKGFKENVTKNKNNLRKETKQLKYGLETEELINKL